MHIHLITLLNVQTPCASPVNVVLILCGIGPLIMTPESLII